MNTYERILSALRNGPKSLDDLVIATGQDKSSLAVFVANLNAQGKIKVNRHSGTNHTGKPCHMYELGQQ